jgi:hypothetical protein
MGSCYTNIVSSFRDSLEGEWEVPRVQLLAPRAAGGSRTSEPRYGEEDNLPQGLPVGLQTCPGTKTDPRTMVGFAPCL